MGQSNDAAKKDAQIMHRKEVCAAGMGLRLGSKHAAVKDVQTKLRKEECVLSMEQRRDAAAEKDVQIML